MLKWLIISTGVLVTLSMVLLGLGKLLHDNEQRVTEIKAQGVRSAEGNSKSAARAELVISDGNSSQSKTSITKNIIRQNLTCISDEQCVLIQAQFADLTCDIAINTIGAAILAKTASDQSLAGKCPEVPPSAGARCQANLCVISK
ncbi:hypothetical protein tinsulaeT_13190 [Thalassotalea insulae]|uniref:Uncharacterized protein n=1 Tax=Thalassotalea insulae TaxID=2056778 RepID=A0ABQ6GS21_9GAMM|nr:hypothetical protein [Thalassotalea insulae]GLX77979.1 hypothetical protein tinsulaeT_13190 [Thalassotalea insulae]